MKNENKSEKARIVIDIEDLREVTAQDEKAAKSDERKAVRGALASTRPTSTIMCPW
jgi:hypothetical protein